MNPQTQHAPQAAAEPTAVHESVGPDGVEACRGCGGRLASDQRYCLNCGRATGTDTVRTKANPASATTAAVEGSGEPASKSGSGGLTPALAAAGVCLSVLFLAVGVLVGRSSAPTAKAPAAAAPIVVNGGGASGSGTNSQAAAGSSSSAPSGAASTPKAAPKLTAAQKATQQKTNAQLNQLSHLSGADYAKASARLPNVIKKAGNLPPPKPKQPGGTCIGC